MLKGGVESAIVWASGNTRCGYVDAKSIYISGYIQLYQNGVAATCLYSYLRFWKRLFG